MAFPLLMRFMYDFELFPSVVSKIRLYQIFLESAEPTTGNALSSLVGEKKITLKGLQNILIRVSEEIFSEELSPEQKIIILLEKMHESQGHRKVLLGQGLSLVSELRCRFTSIYKSHFGPKQHKPAETFQELLTMYEGE